MNFKPRTISVINHFKLKYFLQKILTPAKSFELLLKHIGKISISNLEEYQKELLDNKLLSDYYFRAVKNGWIPNKYGSWTNRFGDLFRCGANISWFYALIRELKPKRIIETGTAAGSMTSVILAAIHKNGGGR